MEVGGLGVEVGIEQWDTEMQRWRLGKRARTIGWGDMRTLEKGYRDVGFLWMSG